MLFVGQRRPGKARDNQGRPGKPREDQARGAFKTRKAQEALRGLLEGSSSLPQGSRRLREGPTFLKAPRALWKALGPSRKKLEGFLGEKLFYRGSGWGSLDSFKFQLRAFLQTDKFRPLAGQVQISKICTAPKALAGEFPVSSNFNEEPR